jgi:uncharacterized integral membrane protein
VKGFFRFITFLVFVGTVLLAFLFAVNNTTEINLWVGTELPAFRIGVIIIAVYILGGLTGLVLGLGILRQLKYRVQIRQLQSQLDKLRLQSSHSVNQSNRKS